MFSKGTFLTIMVLLFFSACRKEPPKPALASAADNDHILLGNPTGARADVSTPENYFMEKTYYKLAYSRSRAIPVWVSWHLQAEDRGSAGRQDDFRADATLPQGWYQVQSTSFSGSGFDRGHNCPSGDRTGSFAANSSTFLMTNIIPQAPSLNQGPWEGLEDFLRTQVGSTNEAYIIMGNYGRGGVNVNGVRLTTVDNGRVTVPKQVWKVAVVMPKGNNDLARLSRFATVIAVSMPNDHTRYSTTSTGERTWRNYLTSVSALEQEAATEGQTLNLLSNVPDSIRTILKNKVYQ
jgi:endonuclease G